MTNEQQLFDLMPGPLRKRIEAYAQAITTRLLDEANALSFASDDARAQWMIDRLRFWLTFPHFDAWPYNG